MTVSIIIKTLNEEAHIAATVESALAALESVGGEVIVADGGSADRTVAVASAYAVRIVQLAASVPPSCGIGPQLGFQHSRDPLVCLMDGDMRLDAGFLPAAIAFLAANADAAGVTGHVREMNLGNLEYQRRVQRAAPENRCGAIDRMNGGGLYRREAIERSGYLSDRNLHGYEEFELGLRLRAGGWMLHRLDRDFASHYGHTLGAYRLLLRRWRSGYLRGIGEMLRAASEGGRLRLALGDLPEVKLWLAVYFLVAALLVLPVALRWFGLALDAGLVLGVLAALARRKRSVALGTYTLVAWLFHAAALPIGFLQRRRAPEAWIDSRVLRDVS